MPIYKRVSGDLNIIAVNSGDTITLDASNVEVTSNLITANLTVSANIQANGIATSGNLTANYFFGDGQYLTNVIANVGGASILQNGFTNVDIPSVNGNVLIEINGVPGVVEITQDRLTVQGRVVAEELRTNRIESDDSAFVTVADGLVVDGSVDVVGDIATTGNINADYILGNGALLTGVITSVANINSGTTILQVVAQNGNIQAVVDSTEVLTITPTGMNLTGNLVVSANALISGNLTVSGTQTIANVDALTVSDPIISLGRGANNTPLTTDDGLDRGTQMWYYTSQEQQAFMGYVNSAANLIAATNVSISNNIVTVNDYGAFVTGDIYGDSLITTGNITGAFILGNGSQLSGIDTTSIQSGTSSVRVIAAGGNIRANVAGNTVSLLSSGGQSITGNITVSGAASVTGNVSGGNISTAGHVTATGNVTGGNIITAGLVSLSSITKTGSNGVGNIGSSTSTFDTVFARATSAQYADLAELYLADRSYEAGTVVQFGGEHEVTLCDEANSHRVAGVISQNPAYIMNAGLQGTHVVPVALVGRVFCLVRAPVSPGDILVSDRDGYARANNEAAAGRIIGKALEAAHRDGLAEIVVGKH